MIPFDINLVLGNEIEEIVKIFNNNDLLVKTTENYILIDDHERQSKDFELKEGLKFESTSFERQM